MEPAVSINHLRIRRTGEGHFTLVQMDSTQKRVTEKHCSGDLEEVMERLLDRHQETNAQSKRARDYGPVLEIIKNLPRRYPCMDHEDLPDDWTDPLDLYGCLVQELSRLQIDMDSERKKLAGLIFDSGPEWVWKNRLRLVAERVLFLSPDDDQEAPSEAFLRSA
jgi:hypothetical protein